MGRQGLSRLHFVEFQTNPDSTFKLGPWHNLFFTQLNGNFKAR